MARITVEDCIKQVTNQYELVILAKERAVQLGRGAAPAVDPENDKKPVIALREIGESKITKDELHDSIVNKLRQVADYQEEDENEVIEDDTFRQMYQGGLSKSEMEKTATRKFTSRTPRIDARPSPIQENNIQDETFSNENQNSSPSEDSVIDSDAIMEAIQNELSTEQSIAAEENLSSETADEMSSNSETEETSVSPEEEIENKS
ncbi:MAG: DNA-directed RNA polymerase subunit omega [Candidatus Pelagibacterales bacterium]|jgi:DNA-directed RNA polymerase subunit omega|tara:strand:- start:1002 stop:1619 length:618 start_codon:yes stop_codon:yes gene_type:complete